MVGCSLSTSPNEIRLYIFCGQIGCLLEGVGLVGRGLGRGPWAMELGPNEFVKPTINARRRGPTPQKGVSPSASGRGNVAPWVQLPRTVTVLSRSQSVVCCVASRRSASLLAHCCAIALATSSSMPDSTARAEARSTLHQSSARRVGALTRGARESSLPPRARPSQWMSGHIPESAVNRQSRCAVALDDALHRRRWDCRADFGPYTTHTYEPPCGLSLRGPTQISMRRLRQ